MRFTVDHDGHVLEVQLVSGTGSALSGCSGRTPAAGCTVACIPPGMDQAQVTVTLQIRYTLER